jgi:hypothetical protein
MKRREPFVWVKKNNDFGLDEKQGGRRFRENQGDRKKKRRECSRRF